MPTTRLFLRTQGSILQSHLTAVTLSTSSSAYWIFCATIETDFEKQSTLLRNTSF